MNHLHTPDSSTGPDPQIPQPEPPRPAPSARRLRANRANARKSRGPITPEGKARSSHNAVKHALLTETILLAPEDCDEFHNLARSFYKEFQPSTPAARVLIDDLVAIHWRRLRMRNLETELLNSAIEKQQAGQPFRTRHAALAVKDLADNPQLAPLTQPLRDAIQSRVQSHSASLTPVVSTG